MKLNYTLFLFLSLIFLTTGTNATKSTNILPSRESWSNDELDLANTAKHVDYLSKEEKNIIFYMNLIRIDGTKFFNTYFQDFMRDHNKRMQKYSNYKDLKINTYDSYYRGLKEDLKKVKNYELYYPDETLTFLALSHGKDMKRHNLAAHISSDGRTMYDRLSKYFPRHAMAENLAFGFAKGLDNVCMLLLDKGVPDLGHRKNMLNTSNGLNTVGVSIQSHPTYTYSATIDFVGIPKHKN
ncbi:CAP domain-containing protein [Pedobacter sp.]|uniref:CAP domain-containing protein n=1 Tax=Pedobacter sp. TaxID=1411316 RepID=UPI003D7F4092